MFRRLSVPFLVLVLGALTQACSSSGGGGGTGGKGGGTGGTASGGGPGTTGGAPGTTGGAPGTDAAVDAPRDTAVDSTTDSGVNIAALCPRVDGGPARGATSASMSAADFCALYLQTCMGATNPDGGYTMLADCMTAYSGLSFETTRQCRSYHVCNAAAYADITMPAMVRTHCGHAIGVGLCPDTNLDAGVDSSGN